MLFPMDFHLFCFLDFDKKKEKFDQIIILLYYFFFPRKQEFKTGQQNKVALQNSSGRETFKPAKWDSCIYGAEGMGCHPRGNTKLPAGEAGDCWMDAAVAELPASPGRQLSTGVLTSFAGPSSLPVFKYTRFMGWPHNQVTVREEEAYTYCKSAALPWLPDSYHEAHMREFPLQKVNEG